MQDMCLYCYSLIEDFTDKNIPQVDDDVSWAKLAEDHADGCSWVRTKAWQIVDEG